MDKYFKIKNQLKNKFKKTNTNSCIDFYSFILYFCFIEREFAITGDRHIVLFIITLVAIVNMIIKNWITHLSLLCFWLFSQEEVDYA